MATGTNGSILSAIHGSVGSTTFRTVGGRLVVGTRSLGRQRSGDPSNTSAARLARVRKQWCMLAPAQRNSWELLANASGLTGWRAFLRASMWSDLTADSTGWSASGAPNFPGHATAIFWQENPGIWIALCNSDATPSWSSVDGIHWTADTGAPVSNWFAGAADADSAKAVAISNGPPYASMARTGDLEWSATSDLPLANWASVCFASDRSEFLAVAFAGGALVASSTNGTHWTTHTPAAAQQWYGVCRSPRLGLYAAVALNGTDRIMTSPDGVTWTLRSCAVWGRMISITWCDFLGLFIAVGNDATYGIWTSPDGVTWTPHAVPGSVQWAFASVAENITTITLTSYDEHTAVAVTRDLVTWTYPATSDELYTYQIAYSPALTNYRVLSDRSMGPGLISPISLSPYDASGVPIVVGSGISFQATDDKAPSLNVNCPDVSGLVWTLGTIGAQNTLTLSAPSALYTSAGDQEIALWVGAPLRGSQNTYNGSYRLLGATPLRTAPYTTATLNYPWANPLASGMRIPVRARLLARGTRTSEAQFSIATIA
jgi:hypothetical protein